MTAGTLSSFQKFVFHIIMKSSSWRAARCCHGNSQLSYVFVQQSICCEPENRLVHVTLAGMLAWKTLLLLLITLPSHGASPQRHLCALPNFNSHQPQSQRHNEQGYQGTSRDVWEHGGTSAKGREDVGASRDVKEHMERQETWRDIRKCGDI